VYDIVASIVTFHNDKDVLRKTIKSFLGGSLNTFLYIIDNSATDDLKQLCSDPRIEYVFNAKNLGFGAGHNMAIRAMTGKTKYSLVLNPDVYFDSGVLEQLFCFMNENKDVGLVMPKVLYPDGSLQHLCRLLPDPWDVLIRKINVSVVNTLCARKRWRYELKNADYAQQMDVPSLSGCFMFVRTSVFDQTGLFDPRFFLYFEDVDLSRRIHRKWRTVYYPNVTIYHGYQRGSYKDWSLLKHHVVSAIRYFNKWGWFFDQDRLQTNAKTIRQLSLDE
jgi:GT2 family glycosyltransferase